MAQNSGRTEDRTESASVLGGQAIVKVVQFAITEADSIVPNAVCYTGDPFATLIREIRDGVTRIVERGQGGIAPYIGVEGNE